MGFVMFNANPVARRSGDCTVRAISTILGKSWEDVYIDLCAYGLNYHDMPSANDVWGAYLTDQGYTRHLVSDVCKGCYTVSDFAGEFFKGIYLLALNGHVVAVIDGNYYDTWDSGDEAVLYYWREE